MKGRAKSRRLGIGIVPCAGEAGVEGSGLVGRALGPSARRWCQCGLDGLVGGHHEVVDKPVSKNAESLADRCYRFASAVAPRHRRGRHLL